MYLNELKKINNYNELNINFEEKNTYIIFDEEFDNLNFLDKKTIEKKDEIFIIKNNFLGYMHLKKIKNKQNLVIIVNLKNNYNYCKKLIKKITKFFRKNEECKLDCYVIGNNSKYSQDILNSIKAISIKDKKIRNEFIYDTVCTFLDDRFKKCNYCDFKGDKCIANRTNNIDFQEKGCCHSFECADFLSLDLLKDVKICEHLEDKGCNTKNISCKLFTCKYLRKRNVKFNSRKILLTDCFFNRKQHDVINYNFFKSREEILEKLEEKNFDVYLWYLFRRNYKVK